MPITSLFRRYVMTFISLIRLPLLREMLMLITYELCYASHALLPVEVASLLPPLAPLPAIFFLRDAIYAFRGYFYAAASSDYAAERCYIYV